MASPNYKFVITKQGLRAARDAAWGGWKIPINGFIVTNKEVTPATLDTANFDTLYDNNNPILYQRIGTKSQNANWTGTIDGVMTLRPDAAEGLTVSITLPTNLNDNDLLLNFPSQWIPAQVGKPNNGNFDFRTIGLLSVNDQGGKILFGTAYMNDSIAKRANNPATNEPGNMYKLFIPMKMTNLLEIIDLNPNIVEYSELAPAATEADVFSIPQGTSQYSSYRIQNYSGTGRPALALRNINSGTETWDVFPYTKKKTIKLTGNQRFASDATIGKLVYLDYTEDDGVFKVCQPNSYKGITGIRISNTEVLISGVWDSPTALELGVSYYLSANGGLVDYKGATNYTNIVKVGTAVGTYDPAVPYVIYNNTTDFSAGTYVREASKDSPLYYVTTSFIKSNWNFDLQYMTKQTNKFVLSLDNTAATHNEYGFTRYATPSQVANDAGDCAVTPYDIHTAYPKKNVQLGGNVQYDETITNRWAFTQVLHATAYQALWADVCEYYEADCGYPVGTIMQFGGDKEVTVATKEANGIVSDVEKAAFILNDPTQKPDPNKKRVPLALTGRVLIRLEPDVEVKKGDKLYLSKTIPGVAGIEENGDCIARALEDGKDSIKCVTALKI